MTPPSTVIGAAKKRILRSTQEEKGNACKNVMVGQEVDIVRVLVEYTYVQVRGFHDGEQNPRISLQ